MAEEQGTRCYQQLKALLLDSEIEMGARLTEAALAERLGASRTPVREALRRLHAEGFVVFSVNRGYLAASYDGPRVREIYSCRALLESEAVRLIAMAGLPAEVDAALARNEAEAEALMRSEAGPEAMRERFLLLNNEFHRLLERACPNRTLAGLIARMAEIPKAIRSYFRFPDEELARSHDQHRKILAAIRRGDAARAGALMREHIWSAQDLQIEPRRNGDPGVAAQ